MPDCSTVERTIRSARASRESGSGTRSAHLLVVDDDPTNRRVLQGMLRRLGYTCSIAHNGAEAVQAIADGTFDAVLMDCLMPVMDGYDATRAIRQCEEQPEGARGRVPVIAVTALAMDGAHARCLDAGMDDYLTKPVMLESLERVLQRWITEDLVSDARSTLCTAGTPQDDPIDSAILDELRALGEDDGPALIAELVRDYGAEVPCRFRMMRDAIAANDLPTLLGALHFVAGCSAIVGARDVERLARSIDARHEPASPEAALVLVDQLEAAYREAYAYLTAVVEGARG